VDLASASPEDFKVDCTTDPKRARPLCRIICRSTATVLLGVYSFVVSVPLGELVPPLLVAILSLIPVALPSELRLKSLDRLTLAMLIFLPILDRAETSQS
jgi:hypothetical protein